MLTAGAVVALPPNSSAPPRPNLPSPAQLTGGIHRLDSDSLISARARAGGIRNNGSSKKRDGGRGRRWQQGAQPPAGDDWRDCAGNLGGDNQDENQRQSG